MVVRDRSVCWPAKSKEELDQREDTCFSGYLVGIWPPRPLDLSGRAEWMNSPPKKMKKLKDGATERAPRTREHRIFRLPWALDFVVDSEAKRSSSRANGVVTPNSRA